MIIIFLTPKESSGHVVLYYYYKKTVYKILAYWDLVFSRLFPERREVMLYGLVLTFEIVWDCGENKKSETIQIKATELHISFQGTVTDWIWHFLEITRKKERDKIQMERAALVVWGTLFLFENETIFPSSCSTFW